MLVDVHRATHGGIHIAYIHTPRYIECTSLQCDSVVWYMRTLAGASILLPSKGTRKKHYVNGAGNQ